jgi:hypothetical protein
LKVDVLAHRKIYELDRAPRTPSPGGFKKAGEEINQLTPFTASNGAVLFWLLAMGFCGTMHVPLIQESNHAEF